MMQNHVSIPNSTEITSVNTSRRGRHLFIKLYPSTEFCLRVLTQAVALCFFAATFYGIIGEASLPGSEIFALFSLAVSAYAGGIVVGCIRLPPLLGMLIVGILYRNLSFIPYHKDISIMWASTFRNTAMVIILIKAGLGLDSEKLKKLKLVVFKLSLLPCILETVGSTIFMHLLLGLPWLWACMLGFIVSAVSAAVLVPGALALEEKKYGIEKGVPTLIMAAVSIDNIIALTGFVVTFSILTSNENLTWALIKRPLEPCVGFLLGAVFGTFLWYIPSKKMSKRSLVSFRIILLCFGGMAFTFVSKRAEVSGAGALSCVSLAFVAALKWRKDPESFETITWMTGIIWQIIEPFLFGLIGAEITIESLQSNLGVSVLVLFLAVVVRAISTILALVGSRLNFKEKIFVSSSWLSKATVQAAVGSQALDYARSKNMGYEFELYGKQVLTVSVLSILLTAPLGAAFMDYLGPYLLQNGSNIPSEPQNGVESRRNSFVGKRNSYGSCSVQPSNNSLAKIVDVYEY